MPCEKYIRCVCIRNGEPHALCSGAYGLRENGMEVCLKPHHGEDACAIVVDGCLVSDRDVNPRCDGIFLLKQPNKKWVVTVELKGSDLYHAYEQLNFTRRRRTFYSDLIDAFRNNETTQVFETSFIVSNHLFSSADKARMNLIFRLNVHTILHTSATLPVPDIRQKF